MAKIRTRCSLQIGIGIRSILKNGAYLAGSTWIETVLRTVYLLFITRMLGSELYGIWAYTLAAYGIAVGMVSFGAEQQLPLRLGASKTGAAQYVGVALTLRLVLQVVAACGIAIYALWSENAGTTQLVMLLSVPAFFGRGLSIWARSVFVGYERTALHVRLSAIFRCLEVGSGVLALLSGGGIVTLIVIHSLFWLLEGAASLAQIRRHLTPLRAELDLGLIAEMIRKGAALGMAAALASWMMAGPIVMLRHGPADLILLGQVALALQISALLVASIQPFLAAALPVLSRSASLGDARVATYGRSTILISALGTVVGAWLGYLLGPGLIVWAIGPEFETTGKLIWPSVVISGLILAPTGYGQYLLVHGYKWQGVIGGAFGAIVLTFGFSKAVGEMGAHGVMLAVAAGWLVRALVISLMGMREIRRQKNLPVGND